MRTGSAERSQTGRIGNSARSAAGRIGKFRCVVSGLLHEWDIGEQVGSLQEANLRVAHANAAMQRHFTVVGEPVSKADTRSEETLSGVGKASRGTGASGQHAIVGEVGCCAACRDQRLVLAIEVEPRSGKAETGLGALGRRLALSRRLRSIESAGNKVGDLIPVHRRSGEVGPANAKVENQSRIYGPIVF